MAYHAGFDIPGADVDVYLDDRGVGYSVTARQNIYPKKLGGYYEGDIREKTWNYKIFEKADAKFRELSLAMILSFKDWKRD